MDSNLLVVCQWQTTVITQKTISNQYKVPTVLAKRVYTPAGQDLSYLRGYMFVNTGVMMWFMILFRFPKESPGISCLALCWKCFPCHLGGSRPSSIWQVGSQGWLRVGMIQIGSANLSVFVWALMFSCGTKVRNVTYDRRFISCVLKGLRSPGHLFHSTVANWRFAKKWNQHHKRS